MTLHVVLPPLSPVFRVARGNGEPPADPFVPPPWERADADGTFGNRFDDPSKADGVPEGGRFRVIYAATQRDGALAETIAHFRPDLEALAALGNCSLILHSASSMLPIPTRSPRCAPASPPSRRLMAIGTST